MLAIAAARSVVLQCDFLDFEAQVRIKICSAEREELSSDWARAGHAYAGRGWVLASDHEWTVVLLSIGSSTRHHVIC